MPEDDELKPLTPTELDEKISEVNSKLKIEDSPRPAQTVPAIPKADKNPATGSNGEGYIAIAWLCILASVVATIYGVYTLYNNDYSARIVGGDAYNYIIYATRGTAWVCVGIVSAVIGLTMAVLGSIEKNSKK